MKGKSLPLPRARVVVANDPYLLRQEEESLIAAAVTPERRDMDLLVLLGEEAEPGEVIEFLQSLSFFGGTRLLVVREFDQMEEWKALLPYLKDPNPSSCLLLTSSTVKGKDLTTRYAALGKVAETAERKRPTGASLERWARERFAARGKEAGPEVVRGLLEAVGNDLATLDTEIEKVSLFAGGEKRLKTQHLAPSLAGAAEAVIWDFLDAVAAKKLPLALSAGRSLLEAGEPLERLLPMVARTIRQLLWVKSLMGEGMRGTEAAKAAGIHHPYVQEKTVRQVSRWEEGDLVRALETASAGDLALKRGRLPADVALDALLLRLLAS